MIEEAVDPVAESTRKALVRRRWGTTLISTLSGVDGCHQVVDDDEHKDGDEAIEEDYYDDDYDQEGASD